MSTTNPATGNISPEGESVPLTRREIRELEQRKAQEAADAAAAKEAAEAAALEQTKPVNEPHRTMVSDTGLPSLFGDDDVEEDKVEEVVVAAPYAREAPVGKYLASGVEVKRLPMLPPKTIAGAAQVSPVPLVSTAPAVGYYDLAVPEREEWTTGMKVGVVGAIAANVILSVAFAGVYLAMVFELISLESSLAGY